MHTTICFISGHLFGVRALEGILSSEDARLGWLCISLVLTVDQDHKSTTVGAASLTDLARSQGLPHETIATVKNAAAHDAVRTASPDFILAIGLSELVPATILDLPATLHGGSDRHTSEYGAIGMHPTLLPKGRGRAPIPWTIIKGLEKTGVTTFLLEEQPDSGGIIDVEEISVTPKETATTLFEKCEAAHYELGRRLAAALSRKSITWTEQRHELASRWPRRSPDDGLIDFNSDSRSVDRLVRALTPPYPGAFFMYRGRRVIVDEVVLTEAEPETPGTIVDLGRSNNATIATVDGAVICTRMRCDEGLPRFERRTSVGGTVREYRNRQ